MIQILRSRQVIAGALITVVTVTVIGVVLVAMTPIGCRPANAIGLKAVSNRCAKLTAAKPTPSPGPTQVTFPTASEQPSAPATPSATPPDISPATPAFPPFSVPVSGSGGLAIPGRALSCRLPVYVGPPGSGGFIAFPGGTFIADPKSGVTVPSPSPGGSSPAPVGPGYGQGYPGLSYDRAYSRWLAVPYTWVSPDGSRYAHPSSDSIYVENVATGATIELGQGHAWAITGVSDQAVYASIVNQSGLWQLPFSGPARQITQTGFWVAASTGAAYGSATSAVPQGIANTIIRLDVNTGAITDWFTRQAAQSSVFGLDAHGNPLIWVSYFSQSYSEMWSTTGPATATPIFSSDEHLYPSGPPIGDGHGVWFPISYNIPYFQSTQGVVLYVAGSGLYWMSSLGTQLAGGCF